MKDGKWWLGFCWDEISAKRKKEGIGVEYFIWNPNAGMGHHYFFKNRKVFIAYTMLENEQWTPYRSHMCSYVETEKDRPIYKREKYEQLFKAYK